MTTFVQPVHPVFNDREVMAFSIKIIVTNTPFLY